MDLYVDINSPATRQGDVISYTDLDVIRFADGRCEIVDQDELAEHQVQLAYPADVIAATELAAADVLRASEGRGPPLDGMWARRWAAAARAAGLTWD